LIDGVDEEDYQIRIKACLSRMGISVTDVAVERGEDQSRNYRFTLELPDSVSEDDVISQISYPCRIKSAS